MRRIKLVLAALAVMVAAFVAASGPAMAQDVDDYGYNHWNRDVDDYGYNYWNPYYWYGYYPYWYGYYPYYWYGDYPYYSGGNTFFEVIE